MDSPSGHVIHIGPDPLTSARIQADLIAGDVRSGQVEKPRSDVKYKEPKAGEPDEWKTPAQVNATGEAKCSDLSRAYAPLVDASHVGVIQRPGPDGAPQNHSFLVADAKPGEAPIVVGTDGKAASPIPADRIVDPNVPHGMNGGKPLPAAIYQDAHLAPIYAPGEADLSHVHAPADDRAAEGHAYQGAERLHTPRTEAGGTVAETAHLAARLVTPPPAHVAGPIEDKYPHPILDEIGKGEDWLKRSVGWTTTPRMAHEFVSGLQTIAAGTIPAKLADDPPLTKEHQAAANAMLGFLSALQRHATGSAEAVADLEVVRKALAEADHATLAGDAKKAVVSEVDAMLPGVVPRHVREHLAPRADVDYELAFSDAFNDRGGGPGGNLALGLALSEALGAFAVGHPQDGRRPSRPRRQVDPKMGAVAPPPAPAPPPPAAASSPAPTASTGGGSRHGDDGDRHDRDRGRDHDRDREWPPRWRPRVFGGLDEEIDLVVPTVVEDNTEEVATDDTEEVIEDITTTDYSVAPSTEIVRVPGPTKVIREVVPSAPEALIVREPERVQVEQEIEWPPRRRGWRERFVLDRERPWTPARAARDAALHQDTRSPAQRRKAIAQDASRYSKLAATSAANAAKDPRVANDPHAGDAALAAQRANAALHNDPLTAGIRGNDRGTDPPLGAIWHGRYGDRLLGDPGLTRAISAWRRDPYVRAKLEAGGAVNGYTLDQIQNALGIAPSVEITDPPMGFNPLLGMGGRRGGRGGRGGYWPPVYSSGPAFYDDDSVIVEDASPFAPSIPCAPCGSL